jgi:DNA-binding CsgD family transcriptional regulator
MADSERQPILAGLVNPAAEALYRRLRTAGPSRADVDDPATAELLDLGVAFRSGPDGAFISPVDLAVALRLLIKARQQELAVTQRRILDGWDRLAHLLPPAFGAPSGDAKGIRTLTGAPEIATRATELYLSTRTHLRSTAIHVQLRTPPAASVAAGIRFQAIYQSGCLDTKTGSEIVAGLAAAGEEIRLRARISAWMLHVDDTIGLVGLDRSGETAALVRSPAVLAMLAEWFDLLWEQPTSVPFPGRDSVELTEMQRTVLTLMVHNDDEGVARKLDTSVSTVRRHIRGIYQALGVNSRFAAGMAAAKRNWI